MSLLIFKQKESLVLSRAILVVLGALLLIIPLRTEAFTVETLKDVEVRGDFVLGPGKTELFMDPGDSQVRELVVTNRTGRDVTFKIEIEDFVGSRDPQKATILLGNETGPYSLKDYLEIEKTEFVLKHGERARTQVKVSVPFDAEPGGRYGTVLLAAQPAPDPLEGEPGSARGGAKIITRLGTLFFVRVSGDVAEDGILKDFRTIGGKVFSSGPILFELLFDNTGSVHLNPYGIIEITNLMGRKVGEIEIDPWFAMPDSLRFREVKWDKGFLFGRYEAHAEINRGYQDIVDEADLVFWVIPWGILISLLVIIFMIVFSIRWVFSKFEIKRKQ